MGIIRITDRIWKRFRAWASGGPPLAPTTLTATVLSETQIKLDWDDAIAEESYNLESSKNSGSWTTLYSATANTITYTASCEAGYSWKFRIQSVNKYGTSDWLESNSVTSYVNVPTSVTASQYTVSSANVYWTDTSSIETGFHIQKSVNGAAFATLANVSANVVSYTDTNVAVGSTYSYQVSAIADGSDSNFSAASANLSPTYLYGYPAAQAAEPNVVAQWLFDEASGNAVDEVSGIVLSPIKNLITYNVAATGVHAGLSPGMRLNVSDGLNKEASESSMTINADHVSETWYLIDADAADGYAGYLYWHGDGSYYSYVRFYFASPSTKFMEYAYRATDGTSISGFKLFGTTVRDGNIHKFRVVLDLDGNIEFFSDGVSMGTANSSSLNGKQITFAELNIGQSSAGGIRLNGDVYEHRWTVGNKTNNSGGPNGG